MAAAGLLLKGRNIRGEKNQAISKRPVFKGPYQTGSLLHEMGKFKVISRVVAQVRLLPVAAVIHVNDGRLELLKIMKGCLKTGQI